MDDSKVRDLVRENNYEEFKKRMPLGTQEKTAKRLFEEMKKNLEE